jgi:hypothetical protein
MILQRALNDMIEPIDRQELVDRIDPADAIDPIERIEPIEPTDSTEPLEPIDSTEFSDHSDHLELAVDPGTQRMLTPLGAPAAAVNPADCGLFRAWSRCAANEARSTIRAWPGRSK